MRSLLLVFAFVFSPVSSAGASPELEFVEFTLPHLCSSYEKYTLSECRRYMKDLRAVVNRHSPDGKSLAYLKTLSEKGVKDVLEKAEFCSDFEDTLEKEGKLLWGSCRDD